ncbi:uncharacterized protein LOC134206850 [Armigeres subalbatus]|uniref:uncharacterized protein LOC134206850 n=1 Tax=Armigeres subalbatus TaxID=124917 RepID=UPI002ED5898B
MLSEPLSRRRKFEVVWDNMRHHYRSKIATIHVQDLDHLTRLNHGIDAVDPSLQYSSEIRNQRNIHHVDYSLSEYASDNPEEKDIVRATTDNRNLDVLWVQISEAIWEIQAHEDFTEPEGLQREQLEMENRYYDAKSFLAEKVGEVQNNSVQNQSTRPGDVTLRGGMDHVRLPQIQLQSFDGNIDDWLSFRDLYTSLIHEKQDLPDVEKFHYLKGCLAGEAKALVDPLKITRDNYQVAWQSLLKRYNNSKLLRKKQVQALFKLPSFTTESIADLHRLVDGFDRVILTLDQIIQPAQYKDLLLVKHLSASLDPSTRRGWEEHSSTKEQDTIKDLLEFL